MRKIFTVFLILVEELLILILVYLDGQMKIKKTREDIVIL